MIKASRDRSNIEAGVASFATLFYCVLYNLLHSHEIPAGQGLRVRVFTTAFPGWSTPWSLWGALGRSL